MLKYLCFLRFRGFFNGLSLRILPIQLVLVGWVLVLLILTSAVAGCRPSAPERAKLWSVRFAEAFDRFIKTGRAVSAIAATGTVAG